MSLLDRKLLRDLRALKSQALAVALVMACGLAMMIMTRSLILSLTTTRDEYYEKHHFAQVFARLKRAPNAVRDELTKIPGVAAIQTGIAIQVTLDVPGLPEPSETSAMCFRSCNMARRFSRRCTSSRAGAALCPFASRSARERR